MRGETIMWKKTQMLMAVALLGSLLPLPLTAQKKEPLKLPQLNTPSKRFYMVYPAEDTPVIDGFIEKDFWGKLPRAKYFTNNTKENESATRQTAFRIAYDKKYLYIGATMFEPFPEQLKDGKDGKGQDSLSFIFSTKFDKDGNYQDTPYIILRFNYGGTFTAVRNALPAKKLVSIPITKDWQYAYSKDDMRWFVEARIPFASLGFSPEDEYIYFNAKRELTTVKAKEKECMWSEKLNDKLGVHSLAYLTFEKKRGNMYYDTVRLNASPRFRLHKVVLHPIGNKKGDYMTNFMQFGKDKNWKDVKAAADKIGKFLQTNEKKGILALIVDELDEYHMEYIRAIAKVYKPTPPRQLNIPVKNAVITSVSLNGEKVPCKNGKYMLPMESGISTLEITAEAKGTAPALRIALAGSPETAETVFAFNTKGVKVPLTKADGYIWAGKEKKLTFRQKLVWHKEYCNHPYTFIGPNVKKWGVSPGETMNFIHKVFDVNRSGKKADYTLIVEFPEGFKRINDHRGISIFSHYPTKNVKEEKIKYKGENYLRYTYKWTLPAKLDRNLDFYTHFLSVKHETYKFKKNNPPVIRFRRIIDGNTTDIVNEIPLHELPPIRGGKMKKIVFPQYHNYSGGYVSYEQWEEMVKNSVAAGLDSFMLITGYPNIHNPGVVNVNKIKNRYAKRNLSWMHWNLPLWGSGQLKTATRLLVEKTPDLHSEFFYKEDKGVLSELNIDFCITKAVEKYRKEFMEALIKDYKWTIAWNGTKNIFINDERGPRRADKTWKNISCFCQHCKDAFFRYAKIKPYPISNEEFVKKYELQWEKFWKYYHKNKLLSMVHEAVRKAGGILSYYHTSSDSESVAFAKDLYDNLFVTIPGCAIYTGSNYQPKVDFGLAAVRKHTGRKNLYGQFRTYVADESYSSDDVYYHPEETKHQLLRIAASLHGGAICECASFFSAGSFYYAGEATRIIAEYEDIFFNGTRNDDLAGGTFQYPDKLVLTKGKERLVLLFNEDDAPRKGELLNLKLEKGQKAKIVGTNKWINDPSKMPVTIPAKEVVVIYIK